VDLWVKGDYLKGTRVMGIPLDSKQIVSFEKLLMSQVLQQEALIVEAVPERNFFPF
jgi:hypothetical protein